MKEHRISIDGFLYRVLTAGAGPALVLLHGFTGTGETWSPFIARLSRDWHVIVPDLPGHGGTHFSQAPLEEDAGPTSVCSLEDCAGHLSALLDHFGAGDAVVIGYSLGGRTGLTWAAMADERVRALVLEGSSPGIRCPQEREERRGQDEALARFIETEGVEAFVERWERLPLFASQKRLPDAQRRQIRKRRLGQSAAGLAASLRGMGAGRMTPLDDELPRLDLPVLLMAGELDDKYCRVAEHMARRLPRATVRIVSGVGHAVHVEGPEGWLGAVLPFLRQVGEHLRGN